MVEPIKVGRFIAQNRKNLNLTQKELADSLSMETVELEILMLEAQRRDFHDENRLVGNIYKDRLRDRLFVLQGSW